MKKLIPLLASVLLTALSTHAAFDCFLKLEGVPGESTDADHKDEIEIESFSMGISRPPGSTGAAQLSDLNLSKYLDKASPLLMLRCADGKHIPTAVLTCRSAGEKPVNFYVIRLTDVIVTSVSVSGAAGSDRPTESLSLNYARIEWEYTPISATGAPGTPIRTSWDAKEVVR
jgi:type VI secretion system secreted protein Hcp